MAFVAEEEVVEEHAEWRHPELKSRLGATQSSVVGEVDAATFPWVAGECNRVLRQESTGEGERLRADMGRDANVK